MKYIRKLHGNIYENLNYYLQAQVIKRRNKRINCFLILILIYVRRRNPTVIT